MSDDGDREVSPAERAHQRRRDRKRETRMVVDNAGVRRLLPVIRRRAQPKPQPSDGEGGTPGLGSSPD